jgi:hypothetical protein
MSVKEVKFEASIYNGQHGRGGEVVTPPIPTVSCLKHKKVSKEIGTHMPKIFP